jgi:hypothetical protein
MYFCVVLCNLCAVLCIIVLFYVIFVLFFVLFVLCRSVYCLCVNAYCTTATGWQPNCSLTNISYHNVEKCGGAGQCTDGIVTQRMRLAYRLTKATDTHSEY